MPMAIRVVDQLVDQADVAISSPSTGQVLTYNGSKWANAAASGGSSTAWQTLTDGATISWAGGSGNGAQVTLAGNRTLSNPTGLTGGQQYSLLVKQDATGGRTLTYGSAYYFQYGGLPRLTPTANAQDVLLFESDGTHLYLTGFIPDLRASGSFTPTSLSGLQLWLKADAITGTSDGTQISAWTDSSSNGVTTTQATSGKQPVYKTAIKNGLPVVRFDATDDTMATSLSVANSTNWTIFLVFSQTQSGGNRRALQGSNNWLIGQNNTAKWSYYNGSFVSGATVIAGTWVYATVTQAAAGGATFYVNGAVAATNSGTGGPGTLWLGAGGAFSEAVDGDIAEVIVYNRVLNTTELSDVHTYLASKWAI